MTSPAQLKYLEAMGIPVWVSRDLVISAELPDLIENDETPCADSAQDLLNSLENQAAKPQSTSPQIRQAEPAHTAPVSTQKTVAQPSRQLQQSQNSQQAQQNEIGRTQAHIMFASGSLEADWIVIGQSPDSNESSINQPYPYDSGELLNNMLRAVGINQPRTESYWINILKLPKSLESDLELNAALELNKKLTELIVKIKPKMVLIVGQIAAQNLLQIKEPLARIRLKQHEAEQLNKLTELQIPSIVTYYPSYLLSKPQDKAKAWEDLKLAMSILSASQSSSE